MRHYTLALPRGQRIIKPLSTLAYFSSYLPLVGMVEQQLQVLGGWGPLVVSGEGWRLLAQIIRLVPTVAGENLHIEDFGEQWWRIPPLLTEALPELHQLPEREFKRLSAKRGKVPQSDDPLVNLMASCPEDVAMTDWLSLDPATLHEFQWVRNQSAFAALSDKDKAEIWKQTLFDRTRDEAAEARKKILSKIPGLNIENS